MTLSDARSALHSALIFNLLLIVVSALAFLIFPSPLASALTVLRFVQLGSCCVWLLVLRREWRQPHLGVSLAAFGFAPLIVLAAMPVTATAKEAAGLSFEPFLRQRALVYMIAILTPRQAWVAVAMISLFAVEVCLEYWIPWIGARRFGPYEPWVTLLAFTTAIWIALSRGRLLSRERRLDQDLRRATAALRIGEMAEEVLDLANTPLQVIELQLTLLEERHRPLPQEVPFIRRALTRLCRLTGILSSYRHQENTGAPTLSESFPPGGDPRRNRHL
jgi:hypothetical protein